MRISLRIICVSLFLIFSNITSFSQPSVHEPPRLVVGIMVDGLQQKHIDKLWNYFDINGLKKIIEQGASCENVHYNIISAGNASDIANVMTGSTSYFNGIVGNCYYNVEKSDIQSIINDISKICICTKITV